MCQSAIQETVSAGLNPTSQIVEMPDGGVKAARVPENLEAYRRYLFGFAKIALTSQMADPEEGIVHYQYATAWPCSQLLAQSFDTELLEEIGDAVGREMEEYGVTVWLAPGMNIHRNPLCGRTFEYYSEDPLVSGKMAAAVVRGVQSHKGKGMSAKHFAANNCELERNSSSSNVNERALREIYLRGFEIAVKESKPMTVMASYNMVNGVYATNSYDLLVKVLRNEWGFEGLVMSDWYSLKADREDCLKAVTSDITKAHQVQCDLVMPGRPDQIEGNEQAAAIFEKFLPGMRSKAENQPMIKGMTVRKLAEYAKGSIPESVLDALDAELGKISLEEGRETVWERAENLKNSSLTEAAKEQVMQPARTACAVSGPGESVLMPPGICITGRIKG